MTGFKSDKTLLWIMVVAAVLWSFRETSAETTLARIFIVLCCFPVHECAHAWTARKLGDNTAFFRGRVSLNPFAHLDPFGTFMIFAFGFGYAKPVPVDMNNFPYRKRKTYYMYTSLAGPVSNLLMALIFMVIMRLVLKTGASGGTVMRFLSSAASINVMLAVFNLLPVPPLDGSSIWGVLIPGDRFYKSAKYSQYAIAGLFIVSILLHRLGFYPLSFITGKVFNGLWSLTGWIR